MTTDPMKDFPGYALRRASAAAMAGLAERLAPLKLRPSEASILVVIDANPRISQSEVGRLLDVASANMAPLISRIEERDLLRREPVNGRTQALTLTREGMRMARAVRTEMEAYELALIARIPADCRKGFLKGLRALWDTEGA